ncbi:xylanase, partial [Xanthomonas citri pv. citri]|nr:xylanase [Xanthomonas citri pv. citri]
MRHDNNNSSSNSSSSSGNRSNSSSSSSTTTTSSSNETYCHEPGHDYNYNHFADGVRGPGHYRQGQQNEDTLQQ